MIKNLQLILLSAACLIFVGCQKAEDSRATNAANLDLEPAKTAAPTPARASRINVPQLAGKTPAELDAVFGAPAESKSIESGGEYRLYQTAAEPKGLAVRFYGGRARSFNLIVEKTFASSKEALRQAFGIDVGNAAPVKDAKEPLTEKYEGVFGGVKFAKAAAKKQSAAGGFVFVIAEVGN